MSAIEERIVSMKFDGDQFLTGIQTSLAALDKLNSKLKMEDSVKGLDGVGDAAQTNSSKLSAIVNGVENIGSKFKTMSVIGIAALTSITDRAVSAGLTLAKSLTINPIKAGFENYETQIKAVQTILANTASEGTKIGDVNKVLAELNDYANKTVYNFSEMTQNIGTFTAAGVKLKPAAEAIKGIANLAALSGSSSEQASTAMYQLSQSIAAGKVQLQDWNSVVNAGLGGKTFQNALVNTARASGVAIDSLVKKAGGFRNSLQKGWLTSDILTKTLSQFTGDLTEKQIKSMGYSDAQAKAILKTGQIAVDAATKIKTMSQLMDALKEEVATAWAGIFKTVFGNINQATDLFSKAHTIMENALTGPINSLNTLLQGWAKLGGRAAAIQTIENVFKALAAVMKPIKEAFREIFPPATAKELADITKTIRDFTKNLIISGSTANEIKRTFAGVFAVLKIGWDVVKGIGGVLAKLFGIVTGGSGGFLHLTAEVGDFLVALEKSIESGKGLEKFFQGLGNVLAKPLLLVQSFGKELGKMFSGFDGTKAAKTLVDKLRPLTALSNIVGSAWSKIGQIAEAAYKIFEPIAKKMGAFFSSLGKAIASSFAGLDFGNVLKTIDTGLFAGLVLLVKKLVDAIKEKLSGGKEEGGGFFDTIKESFEELTNTLSAMQKVLKATVLLEIAAAVGILVVSLVALSKIDGKHLASALAGIAGLFAELAGTMIVLQKFAGGKGSVKLPIIAAGMILVAAAVDILASAVKKLAGLDWNGLAKGLTGVTVLLAAVVATMQLMPDDKKMLLSSVGLIAMAAGIKILADAVTQLSGESWGDLAKGLAGVAGVLGALGLFTKFSAVDKMGITSGAGILILAAALKVMASAMKDLSGLSWSEIAKGLSAMAGGLVAIAGALKLMPDSSILSSTSILIVAASLGLIADALDQMASMSWSEIGKGLTVLASSLAIITIALDNIEGALPGAAALAIVAGSLVILGTALGNMGGMSWDEIAKAMTSLAASLGIIAGAMALMEGALPGAAALIVVAGALAILTPVLMALGQMSWEEIAKGMTVLAVSLTILGVAALAISEVSPVLLIIGASIALIGVGAALAGVGVLAFSAGLAALAISGVAGAAALVAIVSAFLGLVPAIASALAKGIIAFAEGIGSAGPAITKALTAVIGGVLDALNTLVPKIVNVLLNMLNQMLNALVKYAPRMVSQGAKLITSILNGVASKIGGIVTAATNVAVAFINGISKNQGRVISAGVKMIISFINGLASAIRSNSAAVGAAGANLGVAIVEGMARGIGSGLGVVVSAAKRVAESALSAAKGVLGIHSPSKEFEKIGAYVIAGFRKGLDGNKADINAAFTSLTAQLKTAMSDSSKSVDTLTAKLKKLKDARHKDTDEIKSTTAALAQAKKEHAAEVKASADITKAMANEHTKLGKLADQYDVLTTKISAATDAYNAAVKTRDDYNTSLTEQYSTLTQATGDETVATYVTDLKKQLSDTKSFINTLQQLRAEGLGDDMYKQLLATGTSALPFVQELLKDGKTSIDQINSLDGQIDSAASSLGSTASSQLYQAAVDSAAGLVKGLQNQQAAIEKQMDTIADAMVKSIKKALGIKSPSRVFAEVGGYAGQGLTNGLADSSKMIATTAANMGNGAVDSLRKSLAGLSDIVTDQMIDAKPTITPVLDLTQFKKDASTMSGLVPSTTSLSVNDAYQSAQSVLSGVNSLQQAVLDSATTTAQNAITYNQYNTSPKALSSIEIYRGTKNQLSKTKGALTTSVNQS